RGVSAGSSGGVEDEHRARLGAAVLEEGDDVAVRGQGRDRAGPAGGVNPLAVAHGGGLTVGELAEVEGRAARLGHREQLDGPALRVRGAEGVEVRGAVEGEGADVGASQRGEVAAGSEGGAEVAGEGADVGTRGAPDDDVEVGDGGAVLRRRRPLREHVETVDGDGSGRELDLLPAAD